MLKNYLKTAIQHGQNQKGFAFINVLGLSVGIACFSLLLLLALYQFSFDRFHKKAATLYRLYEWDQLNGGKSPIAYTDVSGPGAASPGGAMKQYFPDVREDVRLQLAWGENLIRTEKGVFRAPVSFTDPSFFSVFDFPLAYGNAASVLQQVKDIVVTAARAKMLFGTADVVGKTVELQIGAAFQPFRISGVARDPPANSTIQFDVLGTYAFATANADQFFVSNKWHPTIRQTWVQLRPGSKLADDTRGLARFMQTFDPGFEASTRQYIAEMKKEGIDWRGNNLPVSLRLQPLLSIHTDNAFNSWGFSDYAKIDPRIIWIVLAVATGILLIAGINFTTLAIGRLAGRSKEVGVRKVIGAGKRQIVSQFLVEALLLSLLSTAIGLGAAKMLLPWFNQLTGADLHLSFTKQLPTALLLIGAGALAGLLAGGYPAMILSNLKPVEILKSKGRIGGSNLFMKALVTVQFVLSIGLIVSTVVIIRQTGYMMAKNPGFDRENVVAIDGSQTDPNTSFPRFKQALLAEPSVMGITSAAAGLGAGEDFLGFSNNGLSADINIIDSGYIRVLGMRLLAGQNLLTIRYPDSVLPLLVNETMARGMGWSPEQAVGKQIHDFQGQTAVVTGVVNDFHDRPLKETVRNLVFETTRDKGYSHFYVRIHPGDPATAISAMKKAWNRVMPGVPMKYSFLAEDINHYYQAERKWSELVGWSGGIAIFLAFLGLLGLAALAASERTKEIGVRKVLGASVLQVAGLLLKDFLWLVFLAFLIATPLSWMAMHRWLEGYADRTGIGWPIFAGVGAGALLMAGVSISFSVIKAATSNPIAALRSE